MTVRASSSKQIDALIADLGAASAVTRETALARLTVLGARAAERLIAAAQSGAPNAAAALGWKSGGHAEARAAAWRALEAIGDVRALEPALAAIAAADLDPAIGAAATGVARVHLGGAHGVGAVDSLATVLVDRTRHESVRLAALRALRDLEPKTIAPVLASLADDPNATIRAEAGRPDRGAAGGPADPAAEVTRAAEIGLPEDAGALRRALNRAGRAVPLPRLLKIVERVREREALEPTAREEWHLTRAAAHVALANRHSRLALYDLRESLDAATGPLPVEFLTALSLVADASCLEAVAGAYRRARNAWWRDHLAQVFREIVARERLTRRHAAIKRIEKRWPGTFREVWPG